MTSLKRYLLFLAASHFLSVVPTVAEVVNSVSDCGQFLLTNTQPQVPGILENGKILDQSRYKLICQTLMNEKRFLTLYDIKNKIPVFSAYKYRGAQKRSNSRPTWKIEPQLENSEANKNMINGNKKKNYNNQAGFNDYRNSISIGYNKGHLFPMFYAFNQDEAKSTFTLTNIVPQADSFNGGSWNKMETCIKCVMDKFCFNNNGIIEGFAVTGAQPSTNNTLNNRVNIPSMLWSAFCCYSSNLSRWIASAHWGDNVPDGPERKYLPTKSLEELYQSMKKKGSEFNVFPQTKCPQSTTVTELYPNLKTPECTCPINPL